MHHFVSNFRTTESLSFLHISGLYPNVFFFSFRGETIATVLRNCSLLCPQGFHPIISGTSHKANISTPVFSLWSHYPHLKRKVGFRNLSQVSLNPESSDHCLVITSSLSATPRCSFLRLPVPRRKGGEGF